MELKKLQAEEAKLEARQAVRNLVSKRMVEDLTRTWCYGCRL